MADAADPRIDLAAGVDIARLADGAVIVGRVGADDAMLVRSGDALYATGTRCTHYSGPLDAGLVDGDTVRCPLHHACFSLRTGEALRAPALDPIACWRVERVGERAFVREPLLAAAPAAAAGEPESVVIVGGGAAGLAAAEMLRRAGYSRSVVMLSADADPPCDRPNLSKDFLAGNAEPDWIPLRASDFYAEQRIELRLATRVAALDLARRRVRIDTGEELPFGALLLATGADPVRLDVPGAAPGQVHTLRSWADSRAIAARAAEAKRAVVVGASFIGLEVAASLRTRGLDVHVVAPEQVPMERVLGAEVGRFVRSLHESHGVAFHLGTTLARMDGAAALLADGARIADTDLVVMGVGVRPSLALAEQAGLAVDRGVLVDEYLQTSAPGVYAAGDIARWPDAASGERIRVEHWVVAERQGQVAALNLLGQRQRFDAVPFFWSQHYDVAINYVGHATSWEAIDIDGSLAARDCRVSYRRGGRTLAVATIGRDLQSLQAERAMERAPA
ncbi:MAG: FAD-dependent oxidoreductase [Betaproteobacteria bacterium]